MQKKGIIPNCGYHYNNSYSYATGEIRLWGL